MNKLKNKIKLYKDFCEIILSNKFKNVDKIEENQTISCQESIITSIIPLFKKCSFAFMIGVLISHPKYLITGVM